MHQQMAMEGKNVEFESVQELLKKPFDSVPTSYNREIKDISSCYPPSHPIPAVDIGCIDLEKLHSACVEWGFFQIINHDVSPSLIANTKEAIERFFALPKEEKLKYKLPPNGYDGYGNFVRGDGKYDWCERIYLFTNPIHRRMMFNQLPLFLRETLEEYLTAMQNVAMKLVKHLGEALKIDIAEMFDDGFQSLRLNMYPPCPNPDSVMGTINHSDILGITILTQLNGVNGLEIKKDGEWIRAIIRDNALMVNVGDIFEILSNGVYKSVEHRAMVNSEKGRISTAFFVSPKLESDIGPMTTSIDSDSPPLFETTSMEKYIREYFTRMQSGKTNLEHYRKVKV